MLNFKEGQTYICTNAEFGWWTEGKEYKVFNHKEYNKLVLIDDQGTKWLDDELSVSLNQFKLKEESQSKVTPKEGQTYVCKRDDLDWWTKDKEYKVQVFTNGRLYITDDERCDWYLTNGLINQVFKLKEYTFDLNTLTTAQLREYVDLLENKENAESLLNDFIERISEY